jgi:hypothetical protein
MNYIIEMNIQWNLSKVNPVYSEPWEEMESCINLSLNNNIPMQEDFVNLTCINLTPVYSELKSWSQWHLV